MTWEAGGRVVNTSQVSGRLGWTGPTRMSSGVDQALSSLCLCLTPKATRSHEAPKIFLARLSPRAAAQDASPPGRTGNVPIGPRPRPWLEMRTDSASRLPKPKTTSSRVFISFLARSTGERRDHHVRSEAATKGPVASILLGLSFEGQPVSFRPYGGCRHTRPGFPESPSVERLRHCGTHPRHHRV